MYSLKQMICRRCYNKRRRRELSRTAPCTSCGKVRSIAPSSTGVCVTCQRSRFKRTDAMTINKFQVDMETHAEIKRVAAELNVSIKSAVVTLIEWGLESEKETTTCT